MSLLEKITLKEEKLKNTYVDQSQWADASWEGQQGEGGGSTSKNFIHQKKEKTSKTLVIIYIRGHTQREGGMISNVKMAS